MKLFNLSSLSYCALILLFGHASASVNKAQESPNPSFVDWYPAKSPSKLLKWTTDPKHAWWKGALMKRGSTPTSPAPVTLPTKCEYVAANTDPACDKGCICGTQCASLYVWNFSRPEPRPQYHICTNWMINHAYQLSAGFQEIGFQIVPNHTTCGWQSFTRVSELRVGRGSIDVNGTFDQPFGDPYELARIEEIMKREYPFVEIIILCATLVGPILMFAGMLPWCVWADRERKFKYRRLPKA